jgi:hypothetical protein
VRDSLHAIQVNQFETLILFTAVNSSTSHCATSPSQNRLVSTTLVRSKLRTASASTVSISKPRSFIARLHNVSSLQLQLELSDRRSAKVQLSSTRSTHVPLPKEEPSSLWENRWSTLTTKYGRKERQHKETPHNEIRNLGDRIFV